MLVVDNLGHSLHLAGAFRAQRRGYRVADAFLEGHPVEARLQVADPAVDIEAAVPQHELALHIQHFVGGSGLVEVGGRAKGGRRGLFRAGQGAGAILDAVGRYHELAAAGTAGFPGPIRFQHDHFAVDPQFPPTLHHGLEHFQAAIDPGGPGVDADFRVHGVVVLRPVIVGAVVAGRLQQTLGFLRVIAVVGKVAFVDADGAPLGDVADALLQPIIEGFHDEGAVHGQGQGPAHFPLAQFRVPDVIGHQGKDFVVGAGLGDGNGIPVLEADVHGPVGLGGLNHRRPDQRLRPPDLESPSDQRLLSVPSGVGLIVLESLDLHFLARPPFHNLVGADADGVPLPFILAGVLVPFGSLENGKDSGAGENGASYFADHIHGHIVDDFPGDFLVEAETAADGRVAVQVQAELDGVGVPDFAVMESYTLAQGEPPSIRGLLRPAVHPTERHHLEVGAVNPGKGIGSDFLANHRGHVTAAAIAESPQGSGFLLGHQIDGVFGAGGRGRGGRRGRGRRSRRHSRSRRGSGLELPLLGHQGPGVGGSAGRFLGRRRSRDSGRRRRCAAGHDRQSQQDGRGGQAAPPVIPGKNSLYVFHAGLNYPP